MESTRKKKMSADEIAATAECGEDVTRFFAGKGKMMPGLPREGIQRALHNGREIGVRPPLATRTAPKPMTPVSTGGDPLSRVPLSIAPHGAFPDVPPERSRPTTPGRFPRRSLLPPRHTMEVDEARKSEVWRARVRRKCQQMRSPPLPNA